MINRIKCDHRKSDKAVAIIIILTQMVRATDSTLQGSCNEKGMWISLIKRIVRVCILIVTVITCTCLS